MKRDKYIISIFVGEELYLSQEGQMKLIKAAVRKIGYYLSVAYYDIAFGIFFCLLSLKLYFFYHLTGFEAFTRPFFADCGILLMSLSLSLVMENKKMRFFYLFFLDLLFSFIFFSNSLFYHYFKDFTSAFDIYQAHQLLSVSDMLYSLVHKEFLFLVDFLLLPFLLMTKLGTSYKFTTSARVKAACIIVLLGLFADRSMLLHIGEIVNRAHITGDRANTIWDYGVIDYQMLDAYVFLEAAAKKDALTQSDIKAVKTAVADKKKVNFAKNEFSGKGKGCNLVVIQAESLQNFVIGRKYLGAEITPNLNRLAESGSYFDNIYDQTGDGNSSDATLLANSSLYPARRGAAAFLYAENDFDTLPKVLEEHGYETAAMHANVRSFWNSLQFEHDLGFEKQSYEEDFVLTERIGWGLSDRAFFSQCTEKIRKMSQPSYAFLRTLTTHAPFSYVTKDTDGFSLGNLEGTLIGGYIRSMHYLDSAIGDFLQELAKADLLSRTIIVIYGDHRARLPIADLKNIGIEDMREENKIPLIISIPHSHQHDRRHLIGGLIDVTPTLCNILGIDTSGKFFLGKDLGNNGRGYAIFRDGSFISPDGAIDDAKVDKELRLNDLILEKNVLGVLEGKRGKRL
jgi:lipoteichoic acid synthase